jgi:putative nucleotidyltransferase with HDIG domain
MTDSPHNIVSGPGQQPKILIVDDEVELTSALCEMLTKQGYITQGFTNGEEALAALKDNYFDVLLVDLMMPEIDGITLLKKALAIDPRLVGIMMTGHGTVQTAVEAMKIGAYDYILKPFKLNTVLTALARSLEVSRLRTENVQLRELLSIYELGQLVAFTLDINIIFKKTAEAVLQQTGADEMSILVPDEEGDEMVLATVYGDGREHLLGEKVPLEGTIAGWVARHLQPLELKGEVQDPRFFSAHPRPDIKTSISMPMVLGNQLVGVLNLNMKRRRHSLTEGQIKGLSILVGIAASALENARLYDAVKQELTAREQRERELEAIAKVSSALRATTSRQEMLPAIMKETCDIFGTEAAVIGLSNPLSGEVNIEIGQGTWEDRAGERIFPGEPVTGQVLQTGQAYVNNDTRNESVELCRIGEEALQAAACVPLVAQEARIGVLWIAREKPFSEADIRLLTSIADIAATSIQRASLYEQTEKRLRRLTALRTIDMAISSSMDLRVTLNVLLDQVTTQLNVDAAAIRLRRSPSASLDFAAGRGFSAQWQEHQPVPLGVGYAGTAALERRTVQVLDLAEAKTDPRRDSLLAEGLRTCIVAPLIVKGEVAGVLEVFHRSAFTPDTEWLDFLEAVSGQAAIAIDNTWLFEHLQLSNQQLSQAYSATIEGWSRALDLRDRETEGHTQRVTEETLRLARAMGIFDEEELVFIRWGGLLHDIGKMGVPDEILHKTGPLNDEEWMVMRKHPVLAYQLISPITYLRRALDIPFNHHERWDGTGYPGGIKGVQIPLAARIFSVIDVWDALRSDRPYRPGWSEEETLLYLQNQAGKQLDPQVVEAFLEIRRASG